MSTETRWLYERAISLQARLDDAIARRDPLAAEQAGYRRGLAESKPQSDLGFPESEYERGVRTEARAHAHLIEKAADEAYERGVRAERERWHEMKLPKQIRAEGVREAEARLRAIPPKNLGKAARTLLGIESQSDDYLRGVREERERIGVQLVERLRELDNLCAMSGNATWAQDTARRAEVRRVLVWLEATDAD